MLLKAATLTFLFSSLVAEASVLVNAPEPYPQYEMGASSMEIYYAGRNGATTPTVAGFNDVKGYRYITTDSVTSTGLIYIDVKTDSELTVPSGSSIFVSLKSSNATTQIVLTGASEETGTTAPDACVVGSTCITGNKGAYYRAGSTLRLSFTVSALCAASASGGGLCSASSVQDASATTLTQNVEVFFGVVSSASVPNGNDVFNATTNTSDTVTIGITDENPTIATCPLDVSTYYFPGDGLIYYYPTTASASANGGVDLQYLITMALKDSSPPATVQASGLSSNTIVHYTPAGNSVEEVTGFTNTTTGSDNTYSMMIQAQNKAGLVSAAGTTCSFDGVRSQNISGVLSESKCFIATAAYQDGRAAPVMMLRKFRDEILSKYSLGRDFIKKYYQYSPALAEWAWDKPIIRSLVLRLLAPIELMAWAILKISHAQEVATGEPSESYIDRVKKNLPAEGQAATTESYLDREKKKLLEGQEVSADANESYIDRLKKKLPEDQKVEVSAEGYSEKERSKLPAISDRESPITLVKEGRDRKLDFGEVPDISNAIGFKLGVTPGMEVTGGAHSLSEVYGTGFKPELMLHYERQLFHSENFGSFGIGTDFGIAYSGGKGLLEFGFNNSFQSITGFSFIQIPVTINAIYRFNLLRILRPYVSAGAGAIFYTETREDDKADKRGYTAVYNGSVGASILMDFLDSGTHRDSFLSNGFQHTYLFIEYLYLNSFKSNLMFKRAGIYSGFLFEF